MDPIKIKLTLKSAATFGNGSGVAGLVDREVEHDAVGFPFLRGKTLKGLLAESAENVVFWLACRPSDIDWRKSKSRLFGEPGRGLEEQGILHIGDAVLPAALREEVKRQGWGKEKVLFSLTSIRRQTAINEYGAPDHSTLRSMRVLLPGITFEALLYFEQDPEASDLQLLAASVLDFRRAGTGRNRGRGWLKAELDSDETTWDLFKEFQEAVL